MYIIEQSRRTPLRCSLATIERHAEASGAEYAQYVAAVIDAA
jgi:hypothetical protein